MAASLWIWRLQHPHWKPGQGWEPIVASTCVHSGGETLLLDPLAPPANAAEVWTRLAARPPPAVVVLNSDHVRDVDLFAHAEPVHTRADYEHALARPLERIAY